MSRVLVVVPVVVLVLSSFGAFVYGTDVFVNSVREIVDHPLPVGNKIGLFLLVVDLFLIGATLLIAAFGLYELFIHRLESDGASHLPAWLAMSDLNDLKARVISMVAPLAHYTTFPFDLGTVNGAPVDLTPSAAGELVQGPHAQVVSIPSASDPDVDGFNVAYGSTQPSAPATS